MPDRYVLVLDLGSTRLRAYVVPSDRPWDVPSGVERAYGTRRKPGDLSQQISPHGLTQRITDVIREAAHDADRFPGSIHAICVTAQRGGTAFLDARGRTLYLGPNKDLRAVFQGAEIDEHHGEEIYNATGHLPSMFFTPAKLRWWMLNRPRQAARIVRILTLGAWTVHRLTGEAAETGPSLAEAGLADIREHPPMPPLPLLADLGIDRSLLPPILPTGTETGVLGRRMADVTGLAPGIPVYLAGPDAQTALLGMGVTRIGDTGLSAGWSAPVQRVTKRPWLDPSRKTWTGFHLVDGRWVTEANPSDTGATVDAIRRLLKVSHARFDELCTHHPDATRLAVALWGPRALDLSAPGMTLGGLLLPSPITQEGVDAALVARATLENVAYAVRECLETLDRLIGADRISPIALTGGMAAGQAFPALLASVTGRPVQLHHPLATATGATIVASCHPLSWPDAAKQAVEHTRMIDPDARAALEQEEGYNRWLRLRARLDELTEGL